MSLKAPELLNLPMADFSNLIEADRFGLEIVGDRRLIKIGKLNVIHGHEFGRTFASPVNPSRGLYLKGKECAICGHYHRTSEHAEKSMNDTVIGCWSTGCLCDLRPDYLPINKWNHGFAVIERLDKVNFHVDNKKIIKGRVY
jgi:hypothetical protein